jgi:hypothetical protein
MRVGRRVHIGQMEPIWGAPTLVDGGQGLTQKVLA